ncbi:hypothetical protein ABIC75_000316 [Dyella japonica]|uniref:Uncharacterized protein n=1 Tax=Dyella japonica TaxID=231455 RepID=A0ABV2JRV9_9GAMM
MDFPGNVGQLSDTASVEAAERHIRQTLIASSYAGDADIVRPMSFGNLLSGRGTRVRP